jgi:hypothetical protein
MSRSRASGAPRSLVFIGHHAVGFAAKRFAPRTSLAVLMAWIGWFDRHREPGAGVR